MKQTLRKPALQIKTIQNKQSQVWFTHVQNHILYSQNTFSDLETGDTSHVSELSILLMCGGTSLPPGSPQLHSSSESA